MCVCVFFFLFGGMVGWFVLVLFFIFKLVKFPSVFIVRKGGLREI